MTEHDAIYNNAIDTWGHDAQMDVAIEELSELIIAIDAYDENPSDSTAFDVADELGDVTIMTRQLEISMIQSYPDFTMWKNQYIQNKTDNQTSVKEYKDIAFLIKSIVKFRREPTIVTANKLSNALSSVIILMHQIETFMMCTHPDFTCWKNGNMKIKLLRVKKMLDKSNQP